jgi:branched-chain amino acid transport system ATP-binding protein
MPVDDGEAGAAPILAAEHVSLRFGGVRALTEVAFEVRRGEVFSIIGPNGAGKTSMVNCISGRYRPTEGAIRFDGHEITAWSQPKRALAGIGLATLRRDRA